MMTCTHCHREFVLREIHRVPVRFHGMTYQCSYRCWVEEWREEKADRQRAWIKRKIAYLDPEDYERSELERMYGAR